MIETDNAAARLDVTANTVTATVCQSLAEVCTGLEKIDNSQADILKRVAAIEAALVIIPKPAPKPRSAERLVNGRN
jgi:hypothetical protein